MLRAVLPGLLAALVCAAQPVLVLTRPVTPPAWALLERELLRANSEACQFFADTTLDSRGYLLHTPRWGTIDDGPDDAIETFYNWTLLHAMGGSDAVLRLYKKAYEGHLEQYKQARSVKTDIAKYGSYYKEFVPMSDWFHIGEGSRAFMLLGLSDPDDRRFRARMCRFAGLYMNEDPEAPNYDATRKLIRSMWTGSRGPLLRKATPYDWSGDPVPGRFHMLHSVQGHGEMLDFEAHYEKMLAHVTEYGDAVGDHPLNMAATGLALNAYMLTGYRRYRDWVVEYATAWKERAAAAGGNIPTNVGLDGKPGGEFGGKWWKGTYGWNFTIFDGELGRQVSRNTFDAGSWPGFANAYLATGDASFIGVLRRQMDNIFAQARKTEGGRVTVPRMYGDPRGYKHAEQEAWYEWAPNPYNSRLTEIWAWSGDPKDLERVSKTDWIAFLEGRNPGYPEQALRADLGAVRERVDALRRDNTTADTRLADYLQGFNPARTDALAKLTLGAYLGGNIWSLHSRVRYFDPAGRRAGLPADVAALVETFSADSVTLSLVNISQLSPRDVIIQAGAYAEHQFLSAKAEGAAPVTLNGPHLSVRLAPGAGARLQLAMKRYANAPTLAQPWSRSAVESR